MPRWYYWIDFVLYPILVIILLITIDFNYARWIGLAFGVLLWTLIEYLTNRVLLHSFVYVREHMRHHTNPKEYVEVPFWIGPVVFGAMYFPLPLSVFCGVILGYSIYIVVHHLSHHSSLVLPWHITHHIFPQYNYGVSTPLWDFLLHTYKQRS